MEVATLSQQTHLEKHKLPQSKRSTNFVFSNDIQQQIYYVSSCSDL
jgi:hypothetical protein